MEAKVPPKWYPLHLCRTYIEKLKTQHSILTLVLFAQPPRIITGIDFQWQWVVVLWGQVVISITQLNPFLGALLFMHWMTPYLDIMGWQTSIREWSLRFQLIFLNLMEASLEHSQANNFRNQKQEGAPFWSRAAMHQLIKCHIRVGKCSLKQCFKDKSDFKSNFWL